MVALLNTEMFGWLLISFGLNLSTFMTNMNCPDYNLWVMDVTEKTSKIGIDVLTLTSFSGWLNVSQNNKTGSTLSGEIPAILLVHTTVLCGALYVSCCVTRKILKLTTALWEQGWRSWNGTGNVMAPFCAHGGSLVFPWTESNCFWWDKNLSVMIKLRGNILVNSQGAGEGVLPYNIKCRL